jgi:hypothetical protein
MAVITLTIPDEVLPRVIEALCVDCERPADSPLTRAQFARQQIIQYVRSVVRQHEARIAREAAAAAADAKADSEITIT